MKECKYLVVDEMCCSEQYFSELADARRMAYNIQGVIYKIEEDGSHKFIHDYSE